MKTTKNMQEKGKKSYVYLFIYFYAIYLQQIWAALKNQA